MGTIYSFQCPACGYSANVSGGDDAGYFALTTTIIREDCRSLFHLPSFLSLLRAIGKSIRRVTSMEN